MSDSGPGDREVAWRLFAAEFDDADFSYAESDEERAPNYVVTPTGARVNRLFVVGVLTEIETVSEDYLRARVVDPSGPFVVYAGQYQPDALAFLERADPPAFVAVTGKARTYEPDDGNQVFTSVRPESLNEVDRDTRDRWVVRTAEATVDRVARMAEAKETGLRGDQLREALAAHGLDEGLAAGSPLALDHYGTTGSYLSAVRDLALDAARVVAGERDEVEGLRTDPAAGDDGDLAALVETPIDESVVESARAGERDSTDPEPAEAAATEAGADAGAAVGTADESTGDSPAAAGDASEPERDTDEETASTATDQDTETAAAEPQQTNGPQTTDTAASPGRAPEAGEAATVRDDESSVGDAEPTEPSDQGEGTEASTGDADPTDGSDEAEPAEASTGDATAGGSEPADTAASATDESASEQTVSGDTGTTETVAGESTQADAGDESLEEFEPEFDLDESEREEIEDEYGTDFQSGGEVDEPGSADIDVPDPDEVAEAESGQAEETGSEGASDEGGAEPATPAEDVDLEDAVMDAMERLDEGDGAEREAVVAAVVEEVGVDPGDAEDAIQDALMDGRCYEPDEGVLKPI